MNKQELIERIEGLKNIFWNECEYVKIDFVIELASELDEPQKVTIPQFVADWIEECKNDDFHLFGAMEGISFNQKKLDYWFREDDNMELFARAWLDGYEVEQEKRYTVKLKNTNDYLNETEVGFHFYDNYRNNGKFTRKEIEDAGFGEVFNSPLFEVEEVER